MLIFLVLALCIAGAYLESTTFSYDINSFVINEKEVEFDDIVSVVEYADGSYIIVTNYEGTKYDVNRFSKYTASGEFVWGKAFGTITSPISEWESIYLKDCIEGDANSIICGGSKYINGESYNQPFVMKVSENGEIVWSKIFTGADNRGSISKIEKITGGILFNGKSRGFGSYQNGYSYIESTLIGKLTFAGEIEWIKAFGGDETMGEMGVYKVKENADGNFVLAGIQSFYVDAEGKTAERTFLAEIDATGNLNYFRTRGRNETKDGKDDWYNIKIIVELSDGYLIVADASFSEDVMRPKFDDFRRELVADTADRGVNFFQKWSKTGEFMWSKSFLIYPTYEEDYNSLESDLDAVVELSDGLLLIGGIDEECFDELGYEETCTVSTITKADFDGNHIYTKKISSTYETQIGSDIFQTSDDGIIAAIEDENVYGDKNMTLVKVFSDFSGCDERYTFSDFVYNLNDTTNIFNEGAFSMDLTDITRVDEGSANWKDIIDIVVEFNYTFTGDEDDFICGEKGSSNNGGGDDTPGSVSPGVIVGVSLGITFGVIFCILCVVLLVILIAAIVFFVLSKKKDNNTEKDTELESV